MKRPARPTFHLTQATDETCELPYHLALPPHCSLPLSLCRGPKARRPRPDPRSGDGRLDAHLWNHGNVYTDHDGNIRSYSDSGQRSFYDSSGWHRDTAISSSLGDRFGGLDRESWGERRALSAATASVAAAGKDSGDNRLN
jgi:hypothetical protein